MKLRSEIDLKYKWDLSKFCENDAEWYKKLEELKLFIPKFSEYKGQLNNPEKLLAFYNLGTEYYLLASKLYMYASNNSNTDLTNATYIEMLNMIDNVTTAESVASSFYAPEMLSYDESYFNELISNDKFKNNAFGLKNLLRSKKHVLSEKEERILSLTGNFSGEFSKIFETLVDSNIAFSDVTDKDGLSHTLTQSTFGVILRSKDRVLRQNAFTEFYKQFKKYSDTIANNFIANLKADWFYAKTSNFDSVLGQMLYPDNINPVVYKKLIDNVNKNLPKLHKYYDIKKQSLGFEDFSYHDLYVSVAESKKTYSFEEGMSLIYDSLNVLGDDYVNVLKQSVKERWMDIYPNKNKRSGAYQSGCYGATPIVLLNYEGQTDDVFTVTHELGHAMHTYYSDKNQPLELSGYTIFLAEVASTVNEVLLLKHLYNNAVSNDEKIYYLEYYLQMFKSTLFRQTMFSEFEEFSHNLIQENHAISKDVLNRFYEDLNRKYQGPSVLHTEDVNYEWLRIPHFYNSFYVYKYATGITSAICIASNIYNRVDNALENYKTFLSSGGNDYSVEILKKAGVNLEEDDAYDIAFKEMQWAINELEKLLVKA